MTRSLRSPSLLQRLTPFLQPAAVGSLLALGGAGLACSGTDSPPGGTAGQTQTTAGAAPVAGSAAGGAPGTAGASPSGGTIGTAGSGTAGAAPTAGSGGSGSVAGSSGSGSVAGSSGSGSAGTGAGGGGGGAMHWVGTWTASPYATAADGMPANGVSLANSVLRQITHASLGGNQIRVQFSNKEGTEPLTIKTAHVALCKATPLVNGSIDTATDKALAFSGMPNVTIPAGMELWSDPVDFALPALGNLTITTAFGSVPAALTSHNGSRTTSFVQTNSTDVSVASMTANATTHWYFISGVDVMAPAAAKGIVAIGDSITDGRGVTVDGNNRWTDVLAARLQANPATANVSIMNQGIGATNLVGASPAAQGRFARDVLGQSGVKYAIVYHGINDIGGGAKAAPMKAVYDEMISAAHAKGLLIYGATITPFGGYTSYYTAAEGPAREAVRKEINAYIKSGVFDGVIDFDTTVTDGGNPPKLQTAVATWSQTDGLHPGPAGYKIMGDSVDLTLFTK